MALAGPPRAVTVARVQAIEISLDWRWAPVLLLTTWLLAQNVLPARFPSWAITTTWLTAGAAILAGEIALLLHELGHALVARRDGLRVTRIVFHGFHAVTHVDGDQEATAHEALIAVAGPSVNLALVGAALALRYALATSGALDAFLLMLVLGNAAAAVLSMVPLGPSDGARALRGLRRRVRPGLEGQVAGERQDQDDEDDQA
jgi:Zn-dependent protease